MFEVWIEVIQQNMILHLIFYLKDILLILIQHKMGNYRSEPQKTKDTIEQKKGKGFSFGASSMCGWRNFMEDSHICQLQISEGISLFGVFDGHGGPQVAIFVEKNFIKELLSMKDFKDGNYKAALTNTFIRMDELLISQDGKKKIEQIHVQELKKNNTSKKYQDAGCTANVILITPKFVYCANAGDARSVARINGQVKPLSNDHKPDNQEQNKRIKAAGGTVHMGRVNGSLAVSRAIGDLGFKQQKKKPEDQVVCVIPEVLQFARQKIEFIIMACDGIWEIRETQSQDVVKFIHKEMSEDKQKPLGKILQDLLEETCAKDAQSQEVGKDNISTILIKFD